MLTWTRNPAQQEERQGQYLSNFRCSRWIMKLILYIVIIILSSIWNRIELASQKRSEHRAIVMLFCDIFVLLCVCVCARAHVRACTQSHDMKQFYQGPQLTATWSLMQAELFAFQPLELGISLNLLWILLVYFGNQYIVDHIIWKYFLLFHRLSFCFFFLMVSFVLQILLSLTRSHLFIFAFASITLGVRSKK